MREIKFRIWHIARQEWLDSDNVLYSNGKWFETFRDAEDYTPFDEADIEVSQFIGLYDGNLKEIYEGDILKIVNGVAVADFHYATLFHIKYNPIEIIGNIYENPELTGGNQ